MKKVTSLALALILITCLILTGCGTSNQAAPAPAEPAAPAAPAADAGTDSAATTTEESNLKIDGKDNWDEIDKLLEAKRIMPEKTGLEVPPSNKDKITIGMVSSALNTQYDLVFAGANEKAASYGDGVVTLLTAGPSSQSANVEQIAIVEAWIQQGVDAICIATVNEEMMQSVYKEAADAGIPIFMFNTPISEVNNPYFVANIGYCQYESGYQFGKYFANKYAGQDLDIVLIHGFLGTHDGERMQGFYDASGAVSQVTAENTTNGRNPNFKVIAEPIGEWVRDASQIAMEGVLQACPHIDIVWSDYDEMSLGALVSIKAAGRQDEMTVYGHDATPDGIAAVQSGDMGGTIDTVSKQMGIECIETIVKYCMEGQDVPKAIYQTPIMWDTENVDQFDESEFVWVK